MVLLPGHLASLIRVPGSQTDSRTSTWIVCRMLLKRSTLDGIVEGSITLQFRRWKRPTVKAGGTLLTAVGLLVIEEVEPIELDSIMSSDALAAGFSDLQSLLSVLDSRGSNQVYRIRLSLKGPDPRIELGGRLPSEREMSDIQSRLDRLDARSRSGAWTVSTLREIHRRPAERAAGLAAGLNTDKALFKMNVRKLKALGLTESLEIGYRLSRRGEEVLRNLEQVADTGRDTASQ